MSLPQFSIPGREPRDVLVNGHLFKIRPLTFGERLSIDDKTARVDGNSGKIKIDMKAMWIERLSIMVIEAPMKGPDGKVIQGKPDRSYFENLPDEIGQVLMLEAARLGGLSHEDEKNFESP